MDFLDLLKTDTTILIVTVSIFSLLIGSFLNAAIYRIPLMLEQEWKSDCHEFLGRVNEEEKHFDRINLFVPRSKCTHCGHGITSWENIPVISYLFLRGKCSSCKHPISVQYPLIELLTAGISAFLAWKLGYGLPLLGLLLFTWFMITLFMIDLKTMMLPDNLTLPLLWLGILFNIDGTYTSLEDSVIGAIAGYLSLWFIYHLFKLVTGKEGLGFGDFKILAAIGAWGGWQILPFVIFFASLAGAIIGSIWLFIILRNKESQPIPFGPWLALAGFVALVWKNDVVTLIGQYFYI
jgi:leader peptidase (prepilin peptidase)/N-methyltransferase